MNETYLGLLIPKHLTKMQFVMNIEAIAEECNVSIDKVIAAVKSGECKSVDDYKLYFELGL